jgi:cytochrome c556
MTRLALLPITLLLLLTACGEVEDTRPGQPVKQRQAAFKEIIKVFEPMGTMIRTDRFDADKFNAYARALVERREAPWSHFGPDTHYPPTKAKAELWQQFNTFESDQQAFKRATDELLAAADRRDRAASEAAYKRVYETCQSCHKKFKAS